MDRYWGEVKPVPQQNLKVLDGGETVAVVGRELKVETRRATRRTTSPSTRRPASRSSAIRRDPPRVRDLRDAADAPPDIDLEVAHERAEDPRVGSRRVVPHTLRSPPGRASISRTCSRTSRRGAGSSAGLPTTPSRRGTPAEVHRRGAPRAEAPRRRGEAENYTKAGGLNYSYQGLARYWRKKA
jgi:hypothetical protein